MNNFYRYLWLVPAAASVLLGVMLFFNPGALANTVCIILGIVALIAGIAGLLDRSGAHSARSNRTKSIFFLIAAAVLLFMPGLVLRSISLAAGVLLAAASGVKLFSALDDRKLGRRGWETALAVSGVGVLAGILLLTGAISATHLIIRLIGLLLAISGGKKIYNAFSV